MTQPIAKTEIHCALRPGAPVGGAVCPLFWQHGEPSDVLRDEMRRMRSVGIRQCILESRPHPDYLGKGWWESLDAILDEAGRLGMTIWFFDDCTYPSGFAGGRIRDRHPHLMKVYLAERVIDARGPLSGASFRILPWLQPDGSIVGMVADGKVTPDKLSPLSEHGKTGEQLVGIVTARRLSGDGDALDGSTLIDLTGRVEDGRLYWDVPEGWWRLSLLVRTRSGGESWTRDYLNPLVPEAVDAYLAEVHDVHFARYGKLFGKTIGGFFTDEPRFGNAGTYEAVLGRFPMVLPWCDDLLAELDSGWAGGFRRVMPALWHDAGEVSRRARHRYMDVVSARFGRNFTGKLGDWCRARGVRLIGHVVEDNNAHARLGFGAGHFFRAIQGQDMGGLDYVYQVWPGLTEGKLQTHWTAWDMTFFYWGVAKMASSAAHIDPKKAGLTMCELFGAYGWQFGLTEMKWLTDHACVRGVNFLVPHAFTPKYPDPDCPPHFYARGANPQWRHFGVWSAYAHRLCELLSGGLHVAPAAVLYHAEAEWAGRCEHFQHAVRAMAQRQIDCDVVPIDALVDEKLTRIGNGYFTVNNERFAVIVVPQAERLPKACLGRLVQLARAGVRVVFTGELPGGASDADDASQELEAFKSIATVSMLPVRGADESASPLAEVVLSWGLADVRVSPASPHLRVYRYTREAMDLWFCVNEDPSEAVDADVRIRDGRSPLGYDAMADCLVPVELRRDGDDAVVRLKMAPYSSIFLVFADQPADFGAAAKPAPFIGDLRPVLEIGGPWSISTATAAAYPKFTRARNIKALEDMSKPGLLRGFGGVIAYETTFTAPPAGDRQLWLDLGRLHQVSEVLLDGRPLGVRICPPHLYDLGKLSGGQHRLRIEVTTTLVESDGDGNEFDRSMAQKPMGLLGPVRVVH